MKNKILVFIIGVLVGAILTTGGFYIYESINSSDEQNITNSREDRDGRPQMPDGEDFKGGTPPEKPDNSKSENVQGSNV